MNGFVFVCNNPGYAYSTPIDQQWECKVSGWFIQHICRICPYRYNQSKGTSINRSEPKTSQPRRLHAAQFAAAPNHQNLEGQSSGVVSTIALLPGQGGDAGVATSTAEHHSLKPGLPAQQDIKANAEDIGGVVVNSYARTQLPTCSVDASSGWGPSMQLQSTPIVDRAIGQKGSSSKRLHGDLGTQLWNAPQQKEIVIEVV